jgi:trans-aconitate methyltransferase
MNHSEMVELIKAVQPANGEVWADLGAGTGNFSWALAELLGPDGTLYALDRDAKAIAAQQQRIAASPPVATIIPRQADVTQKIALPALDGIVAANLLHFIRDRVGLLRRWREHLRPNGRLLVVEYEQQLPIPWVPFPTPYARLGELCREAGFAAPLQIGTRRSPSSGQILYAALAQKTEA